ncbi:hypothetical protein AB1Y20_022442 [Prymnesium parvum]|uniref:Uncharacterized protein n=1 Tax=Prymnesium parvum TaxID=97485 RepID=A0AB34JGB2_PRYPA|mmetsp:Transcript_21801/g.38491  ORF Transcript_21801/g.38491 Transcript_21801/m.38491 type:complete len:130 (+) Transcript_21801:43-432(+)
MSRLSLLLALALTASSAFVLPGVPRAFAPTVSPVLMAVEDVATNCLEEGCPIDLVEELIAELKQEGGAQQESLVKQLTALLKNPEKNKNEIEKMVGAAARTFSRVEGYKFPGEPLGYSLKPTQDNSLDA